MICRQSCKMDLLKKRIFAKLFKQVNTTFFFAIGIARVKPSIFLVLQSTTSFLLLAGDSTGEPCEISTMRREVCVAFFHLKCERELRLEEWFIFSPYLLLYFVRISMLVPRTRSMKISIKLTLKVAIVDISLLAYFCNVLQV